MVDRQDRMGERSETGENGMNAEQVMVDEFHEAFGIARSSQPAVPDETTCKLRLALISEELQELDAAFRDRDLVETADALADLLYVVYGTAVSCGIDIQPVFREVHRSNMTKTGGHRRADGKWVKPDNYSPAELEPVLRRQMGASEATGC